MPGLFPKGGDSFPSPRFGSWLRKNRALQIEAYETDPAALEGEEFIEYLRWNTLAAHTELSEFLQRFPWKPWSKKPKARIHETERDEAVEELVDVLHFVGNMLTALRVSDIELSWRYAAKSTTNEARQASGTY